MLRWLAVAQAVSLEQRMLVMRYRRATPSP
jgi:hypothetical protein